MGAVIPPIDASFDRARPEVSGRVIVIAIDEKPKRVAPNQLKRVRNLHANPRVSLVIDRYAEDWRKLAYALITGKAKVIFRGEKHRTGVRLLRGKYRQYRAMAIEGRPIIVITPKRLTSWGAL